jgi:hypothetical protein
MHCAKIYCQHVNAMCPREGKFTALDRGRIGVRILKRQKRIGDDVGDR